VNTSDEEILSSPESMSYPPSPITTTHDCPPLEIIWDKEDATLCEDGSVTVVLPEQDDWIAARVLPQYMDQVSLAGSMSVVGTVLDTFAPYGEMNEASENEQFEKILGRLLTEWYVVGASVRVSWVFVCM